MTRLKTNIEINLHMISISRTRARTHACDTYSLPTEFNQTVEDHLETVILTRVPSVYIAVRYANMNLNIEKGMFSYQIHNISGS